MEPQLMLDEYDEPVEFKFDPNATSSPSQQNNTAALAAQAQQQQMERQLLLAQQKKQQLAEAAALAAGGLPGTVTLLNSMVSIPKLTPIGKVSKVKVNKRTKLKQNGVSGGNATGSENKVSMHKLMQSKRSLQRLSCMIRLYGSR